MQTKYHLLPAFEKQHLHNLSVHYQTWHPPIVALLWKCHLHAEQLNNVISWCWFNSCKVNTIRSMATIFCSLSAAPCYNKQLSCIYYCNISCVVCTTITIAEGTAHPSVLRCCRFGDSCLILHLAGYAYANNNRYLLPCPLTDISA